MSEIDRNECEECGESYEAHLDEWAQGPDGRCVGCRREALQKRESAAHVVAVSNRMLPRLDPDARALASTHGTHAAVAVQALREAPSAQRATVQHDGRERLFHRADFDEIDVDVSREPRHPRVRVGG